MFDALIRKRCDGFLQFDRVWSCVFEFYSAIRANDADGAQACRAKAHGGPNLAHENRNRSFAIGASDGDDGVGLVIMKACCCKGEQAARVFGADDDLSPARGTA